MRSDETEQLGAYQLDWSGHRVNWDMAPCGRCGRPAFCQDASRRPMHKVCAEPPGVTVVTDFTVYPAPPKIEGLPRHVPWVPAPDDGEWRKAWSKALPATAFRRAGEAALEAPGPHPAPESPSEWIEPVSGDLRVPDQAVKLAAVRGVWTLRRSTWARGTDIDPATGAALGAVECFALVLGRPGARIVTTWRRGALMVCAGCQTPRKPLPTGLVRVHKDCDGGGQLAVATGRPGDWEYGRGTLVVPQRIHGFTGITDVMDYVKGNQ